MKVGLYYEDENSQNIYKVENHTKSLYVLYNKEGEILTISKPCAYRYADKRVTSKKKIEDFERAISVYDKFKSRYVDSMILAQNNVHTIDGDIEIVWESKNVEVNKDGEWINVNVRDIKKNDLFRIVDDGGTIINDFRKQTEFLAFSNAYSDKKYHDHVCIDYIYKEY